MIRTQYINNTKIAYCIRKYQDQKGYINTINVGQSRKRMDIAYGTDTEYGDIDCISDYDMDVADAIYTMYKNGMASFSCGQLLKALSGDKRQNITRAKTEVLQRSIETLRNTWIMIDCYNEFESRGIELSKETPYDIEAKFLTLEQDASGKKYIFPDEDLLEWFPLYAYAECNKQYIAFPPALLQPDTEDKENEDSTDRKSFPAGTDEIIKIKRYLIRRIEVMRKAREVKHRKIQPKIIYQGQSHHRYLDASGMLPDIGIDIEQAINRSQKMKYIHGNVTRILDYFEEIGYITEYTELKDDSGKTEGIMIEGSIADPYTLFGKQEDRVDV